MSKGSENELRETCKRCHERGLEANEHCEYYGEPNGCNHPKGGFMVSKNETVADIVREMRGEVEWKRGKVLLSNIATEFADRIESAYRRTVKGLQNKMCEIVKKMQLKNGDTDKCEECGRVIAFDEYAVNFGLCDDCLNKHLKKDGLA